MTGYQSVPTAVLSRGHEPRGLAGDLWCPRCQDDIWIFSTVAVWFAGDHMRRGARGATVPINTHVLRSTLTFACTWLVGFVARRLCLSPESEVSTVSVPCIRPTVARDVCALML